MPSQLSLLDSNLILQTREEWSPISGGSHDVWLAQAFESLSVSCNPDEQKDSDQSYVMKSVELPRPLSPRAKRVREMPIGKKRDRFVSSFVSSERQEKWVDMSDFINEIMASTVLSLLMPGRSAVVDVSVDVNGNRIWSASKFFSGSETLNLYRQRQTDSRLKKIGMSDLIIAGAMAADGDLHDGNVVVADGKACKIDHGKASVFPCFSVQEVKGFLYRVIASNHYEKMITIEDIKECILRFSNILTDRLLMRCLSSQVKILQDSGLDVFGLQLQTITDDKSYVVIQSYDHLLTVYRGVFQRQRDLLRAVVEDLNPSICISIQFKYVDEARTEPQGHEIRLQ